MCAMLVAQSALVCFDLPLMEFNNQLINQPKREGIVVVVILPLPMPTTSAPPLLVRAGAREGLPTTL